jgi:hypothetical protein
MTPDKAGNVPVSTWFHQKYGTYFADVSAEVEE